MKVKLKANGTLYIYAENELEAYALTKYGEDNFKEGESPKLLIDVNIEVNRARWL